MTTARYFDIEISELDADGEILPRTTFRAAARATRLANGGDETCPVRTNEYWVGEKDGTGSPITGHTISYVGDIVAYLAADAPDGEWGYDYDASGVTFTYSDGAAVFARFVEVEVAS